MHDWSHGYCDICEAIRPTRLAVGGADESGQFDRADLICTYCHFLIASLYRPVKGFGPPG
jgi:hypothetical protein